VIAVFYPTICHNNYIVENCCRTHNDVLSIFTLVNAEGIISSISGIVQKLKLQAFTM
jgi:hypothetical protein